MLSNCWNTLKTNKYQRYIEKYIWPRTNLDMVKILLAEQSAANLIRIKIQLDGSTTKCKQVNLVIFTQNIV